MMTKKMIEALKYNLCVMQGPVKKSFLETKIDCPKRTHEKCLPATSSKRLLNQIKKTLAILGFLGIMKGGYASTTWWVDPYCTPSNNIGINMRHPIIHYDSNTKAVTLNYFKYKDNNYQELKTGEVVTGTLTYTYQPADVSLKPSVSNFNPYQYSSESFSSITLGTSQVKTAYLLPGMPIYGQIGPNQTLLAMPNWYCPAYVWYKTPGGATTGLGNHFLFRKETVYVGANPSDWRENSMRGWGSDAYWYGTNPSGVTLWNDKIDKLTGLLDIETFLINFCTRPLSDAPSIEVEWFNQFFIKTDGTMTDKSFAISEVSPPTQQVTASYTDPATSTVLKLYTTGVPTITGTANYRGQKITITGGNSLNKDVYSDFYFNWTFTPSIPDLNPSTDLNCGINTLTFTPATTGPAWDSTYGFTNNIPIPDSTNPTTSTFVYDPDKPTISITSYTLSSGGSVALTPTFMTGNDFATTDGITIATTTEGGTTYTAPTGLSITKTSGVYYLTASSSTEVSVNDISIPIMIKDKFGVETKRTINVKISPGAPVISSFTGNSHGDSNTNSGGTFSGTMTPKSYVYLLSYKKGTDATTTLSTPIATTHVSDSSWSFVLSDGFPAGSYIFAFKSSTSSTVENISSGLNSSQTNSSAVTISNIVKPTFQDISFVSNQSYPILQGTCLPGSTIKIYANGKTNTLASVNAVTGTQSAPNTATWSYQITGTEGNLGLTLGTNSFIAEALIANSNFNVTSTSAQTGSKTFSYERISINSFGDSTFDEPQEISGNTAPNTNVDVYSASSNSSPTYTKLGSVTSGTSGVWSYTPSTAQFGNNYYAAKATKGTTTTAYTSIVSYTYDTSVASFSSPRAPFNVCTTFISEPGGTTVNLTPSFTNGGYLGDSGIVQLGTVGGNTYSLPSGLTFNNSGTDNGIDRRRYPILIIGSTTAPGVYNIPFQVKNALNKITDITIQLMARPNAPVINSFELTSNGVNGSCTGGVISGTTNSGTSVYLDSLFLNQSSVLVSVPFTKPMPVTINSTIDWSYSLLDGLSAGTYIFKFLASTNSSNPQENGALNSSFGTTDIMINKMPTPTFYKSDYGMSDTFPSISGTCAQGATISIYDSSDLNTVLDTAQDSDENGTWSYSLSSLPQRSDNTYKIKIKASKTNTTFNKTNISDFSNEVVFKHYSGAVITIDPSSLGSSLDVGGRLSGSVFLNYNNLHSISFVGIPGISWDPDKNSVLSSIPSSAPNVYELDASDVLAGVAIRAGTFLLKVTSVDLVGRETVAEKTITVEPATQSQTPAASSITLDGSSSVKINKASGTTTYTPGIYSFTVNSAGVAQKFQLTVYEKSPILNINSAFLNITSGKLEIPILPYFRNLYQETIFNVLCDVKNTKFSVVNGDLVLINNNGLINEGGYPLKVVVSNPHADPASNSVTLDLKLNVVNPLLERSSPSVCAPVGAVASSDLRYLEGNRYVSSSYFPSSRYFSTSKGISYTYVLQMFNSNKQPLSNPFLSIDLNGNVFISANAIPVTAASYTLKIKGIISNLLDCKGNPVLDSQSYSIDFPFTIQDAPGNGTTLPNTTVTLSQLTQVVSDAGLSIKLMSSVSQYFTGTYNKYILTDGNGEKIKYMYLDLDNNLILSDISAIGTFHIKITAINDLGESIYQNADLTINA